MAARDQYVGLLAERVRFSSNDGYRSIYMYTIAGLEVSPRGKAIFHHAPGGKIAEFQPSPRSLER